MATCAHKYIHRDATSFYRFLSRYQLEYVRVDYYFCERCLEQKEVKQRAECPTGDQNTLPEWAQSITKETPGYA